MFVECSDVDLHCKEASYKGVCNMSPKKTSELSIEDLIKLIEERAEDVCGGKMYEVEVHIDELEEDLRIE